MKWLQIKLITFKQLNISTLLKVDSPTFFWAILLKHLRKCISYIHNALSRNSNISATSTAICPSLIDLPKQSYVNMFQGFSWMIAIQFVNRRSLKVSTIIIMHLIQLKSRRLPNSRDIFSCEYARLIKSYFVLLNWVLTHSQCIKSNPKNSIPEWFCCVKLAHLIQDAFVRICATMLSIRFIPLNPYYSVNVKFNHQHNYACFFFLIWNFLLRLFLQSCSTRGQPPICQVHCFYQLGIENNYSSAKVLKGHLTHTLRNFPLLFSLRSR